MGTPRLTWDIGAAYDFFISLHVLHKPADFGLRGVWAAGMRSRLPVAEREFLEEVQGAVVWGPPLDWVYQLPEPKDAATALHALEAIPAARRFSELLLGGSEMASFAAIFGDVAARMEWDDQDLEALQEAVRAMFRGKGVPMPSRKDLTTQLDWASRVEEFGERYYRALVAYYESFFAEEERRIYPALREALERAQQLAEELSTADLIEELTQGLSLSGPLDSPELVLAPAFWSAPLVFFESLSPERVLALFGARPADASLIPGETMPETLLRALKALSDPTRLKIMRYLATESLTPTQLAHRLRLRAPTVVHHLQALRTAGLVQVTVTESKEKSYATRAGAVHTTCDALIRFLGVDGE